MEAIIIDTETTGTADACEVIQLAWREYPVPEGGLAERYNEYFSPSGEIALGAIATHHILPEELEGRSPSAHAAALVPRVDYWIGHNVDFDWRVLGRPPVKRICTLAMARAIWPTLDSHTLVALAYHLGGMTQRTREVVRGAHGAAADIELCRPILREAMMRSGAQTLEELWLYSEDCRIPTVMSFGKWKGYRVEQVDRGYASWYDKESRKTGDRDEYLIKAFQRAGKL